MSEASDDKDSLRDFSLACELIGLSKNPDLPGDTAKMMRLAGERLLGYGQLDLYSWGATDQVTGKDAHEKRLMGIKSLVHFAHTATNILGNYGMISSESFRTKPIEEWPRDIVAFMTKVRRREDNLEAILTEVISANYVIAKKSGTTGFKIDALPDDLYAHVKAELLARGLISRDG